jgi:hypothetical protein
MLSDHLSAQLASYKFFGSKGGFGVKFLSPAYKITHAKQTHEAVRGGDNYLINVIVGGFAAV